MAALTSPILGLQYGRPLGDGPWDGDFNTIAKVIDALLHLKVLSKTTTAPPGSPANGDRYIIPSGATGAWSGKTNQVAYYLVSAWVYFTPVEGMRAYVHADANYQFDGSAWNAESTGGGGATALSGLTDVSVTEGSGIDKKALAWDNGAGKWSPFVAALAQPAISTGWDAAHKESTIVLSNANLTAAVTSGSGKRGVVGLPALTGKSYFEVVIDSASSIDSNSAIGVAPQSISTSGQVGYDTAGAGYQLGGPKIYYNSASLGVSSMPTVSVGTIICVAYDPTTRTVWMRNGVSGQWNNDTLTNQNPATGVGGLVLSGSGAIYPALNFSVVAQYTARFTSGAITGTPPSGFSAPVSGAALTVSLADVNISSPADGDVLRYDATSSKWVNDKGSTATIGSDAAGTFTWTKGTNAPTQYLNAAITADRTVTLSTTNARDGDRVRFTRATAATGAFNWVIGGLKNLGAGTWCEITYVSSAWVLTAAGSL